MKTIYPDYYKSFRCIAHKCRHNCCIGWEIDIDEETLGFYQGVEGDFGKKLRANISTEDTPHFILGEGERCPFLNNKNLCDIFTELGEERLCQICTDHPRFYNYLDEIVEAGLGLCCEAATRLIITKKDPVTLSDCSHIPDSPVLCQRSKVFEILQSRNLSIPQRLREVIGITVGREIPLEALSRFEILSDLERLDESWTKLLNKLYDSSEAEDTTAFDAHMKSRQTEYEQFLCYLIYRHFVKAEFLDETGIYTLFATYAYKLIYAMGNALFNEKGSFTTDDQLEIMRLFSSEIEYSDENLDIILCHLEDIISN